MVTTTPLSALSEQTDALDGDLAYIARADVAYKMTWANLRKLVNERRVGSVFMHAVNTPPTGALECDGSAISRTVYAELFAVISTDFGIGDGSTTFNLPDDRGIFTRGWDNSRGYDAARVFGSEQDDEIESHLHAVSITSGGQSANHTHPGSSLTTGGAGGHSHEVYHDTNPTSTGNDVFSTAGPDVDAAPTASVTTSSVGNHTHSVSGNTGTNSVGHTHLVSGNTGNTGGASETRPKNRAYLPCIWYE